VDITDYKLYYYVLGVQVFKPLNLVPYVKVDEKIIDGKNLDGNLFSTNIMNLVLPI
jgi:hypothetical protein